MENVDPRVRTVRPFGGLIDGVSAILDGFAAMWSGGIEMVLHSRFGRRHLSYLSIFSILFTIVVVKLVLGVVILVVNLFTRWVPRPLLSRADGFIVDIYLIDIWFYAVIVLGAIHHVEMWWRHRREIPCHTRYSGRPHFFFFWVTPDEIAIKRFFEPLFVYGVSLYVSYLDSLMGWYLWAGAGALFYRQNLAYYREMGRAWDLHDAMLEQQFRMTLMCDHRHAIAPKQDNPLVIAAEPPAAVATPPVARIYALLDGFEGLLVPPEFEADAPPGPEPEQTPSVPSPEAGDGMADRIVVSCPACGKRYSLPSRKAGQTVRCLRCNEKFPTSAPIPSLAPSTNGDSPDETNVDH